MAEEGMVLPCKGAGSIHELRSVSMRRKGVFPVGGKYSRGSQRGQWGGMFAGALGGLIALQLHPAWQSEPGALAVILWAAALGSALTSLRQFERAGAALTHSKNRPLNYLAGVGLPLLALMALTWLLR